MKDIKTGKIKNATVSVPGSKSYTHRLLIASALSDGTCRIQNMLKSEDTLFTLEALKQMGAITEKTTEGLLVKGDRGSLRPCPAPIYLGNSGTSMRLLTGVAAIGKGVYVLTGTARMSERPIQDLIDGLNMLNVYARSMKANGCPPVEINGGKVKGGSVSLRCNTSSQFLSSLLLIGPYTQDGLDIEVTQGPVSKPYIDMTIDIMGQLGVEVIRNEYYSFRVPGEQVYRKGSYTVEPDGSNAGYFWAAAAVTGARIKVKDVTFNSRQGDVRFVDILEKMGCRVEHEKDGIAVSGGKLSGLEVNMSNMPDIVPTLAVVAAFADGTTRMTNVAHLKDKESDRLESVARELQKMGISAEADLQGLTVKGGKPIGATIETYDDHRMAMGFAVAGLVIPGIRIKNEKCVNKSFPDFWRVFEGLYK